MCDQSSIACYAYLVYIAQNKPTQVTASCKGLYIYIPTYKWEYVYSGKELSLIRSSMQTTTHYSYTDIRTHIYSFVSDSILL